MINLAFRSIIVLGLLFGLLFGIGMGVIYYANINYAWAFVFAGIVVLLQYILGPFILDWIYKIKWIKLDDLEEIKDFLVSTCSEKRIPLPRIGIIEDGNPNAFTYGHYPGDARLVLTTGLIKVLDEDELKAVAGHELGHIYNWDFVVMTLAAIVPLVLYLLARALLRSRGSSGRGKGGAVLIGIVSYVAYIISEYIVLFLSRVREYYADQFSSKVTRNPNSLASSLVKIAYGLASSEPEYQGRDEIFHASRNFGIFDSKTACSLALNTAASGGGFSRENMVNAMKWDLWNPWSLYYEFFSSHPLPAKRIIQLQKEAKFAGQAPVYDFAEKQPESFWDEFLVDLFMQYLPMIFFLTGLILSILYKGYFGLPLVLLGLGYLGKLFFAFPMKFKKYNISGLVKEVKVSGIRSVPATLKGKVIGRAVPGIMWSKDFVMQDESGFIPLIYKQPLSIWEFIFGLTKVEELVGRDIEVKGWFRRPYRPVLEIFEAVFAEGKKMQKIKCHFYSFQVFLAISLVIIGSLLVVINFFGL